MPMDLHKKIIAGDSGVVNVNQKSLVGVCKYLRWVCECLCLSLCFGERGGQRDGERGGDEQIRESQPGKQTVSAPYLKSRATW